MPPFCHLSEHECTLMVSAAWVMARCEQCLVCVVVLMLIGYSCCMHNPVAVQLRLDCSAGPQASALEKHSNA